MSHWNVGATDRAWLGWLAVAVALTAGLLAWLGYQAVSEWEQSEALLAQRRADATADLLVTAITRDMRGVQSSALAGLQFDEGSHLLDLNGVSSVFARYPYPEAFFAVQSGTQQDSMTFYSRAERPPPWLPSHVHPSQFPVIVSNADGVSRRLFARLSHEVAQGRPFAAFDMTLAGTDYQIVALIRYTDSFREHLSAIVGFVVNLRWVRAHYFGELTNQVIRIQGADTGATLSIVDADLQTVVGEMQANHAAPSSSRQFAMLFFDPDLIMLDPPSDLTRVYWTVSATVAGDRLLAARAGARRTMGIAAVDVLVLVVGLTLTIRVARARSQLAAIRSNFVSAVTHELKTPIATIRALSETLASGRGSAPEMCREYGRLAVNEAKRLTRLVDNLLAYARITDVTEAYSFEPLPIERIVQGSLKEFSAQLVAASFVVDVDIPANLPPVRADHQSMMLAFGNVLENAINYSTDVTKIDIHARRTGAFVEVDLTDHGTGIPENELADVTRKNFRGRGALPGGSGLGLSIVQRIVADHGGLLSIRSSIGVGTTVSLKLPAVQET